MGPGCRCLLAALSLDPNAPRVQWAAVFGCSFSLVLRGAFASQKQMQARVSSRPAAGLQRLFTTCKWFPRIWIRGQLCQLHMQTRRISEALSLSFPVPVPLHLAGLTVLGRFKMGWHVIGTLVKSLQL